ncbi:unnamed protein product, partial [Ectocarpus sp. 13 AM-2016]
RRRRSGGGDGEREWPAGRAGGVGGKDCDRVKGHQELADILGLYGQEKHRVGKPVVSGSVYYRGGGGSRRHRAVGPHSHGLGQQDGPVPAVFGGREVQGSG